MSLKFAVLGLLSQSPMSGFDLIREFDVARSVLWPAPQNEVYRVLAGLEGEGLIAAKDEGPRGRVVYAITRKGRAAVQAWLAEPSDYTLRYEPMLKAVFLRESDPALRAGRAEADLAFFAAQLATLKELERTRAAAPKNAPDPRSDLRRMAIAFYEAMADWARAVLRDAR